MVHDRSQPSDSLSYRNHMDRRILTGRLGAIDSCPDDILWICADV